MKLITKGIGIGAVVLTMLLCSFSSAFSVTKPIGYDIKVQIKGLKTGDTVFLARYYADKRYYQDTAYADVKGNLLFADTTTLKEGMYFLLLPGQKIVDFIMNPTSFSFSMDEADFIKSAQFKNSPDNTAFYDYQKFFQGQKAKADSLNVLYKDGNENQKAAASIQLAAIDSSMLAYIQNFIKTNPKNLFTAVLKTTKEVDVPPAPKKADGSIDSLWQYRYYKQHYFDNVDFTDNRLLRTPVFINKVDTYFKILLYKNLIQLLKKWT